MFDRMTPMVAFRLRFVALEAIFGTLIFLSVCFDVMSWLFGIILIIVSCVAMISLLVRYGDTETSWLRMGLDPETGEALDPDWADERP